ncbi:MAG: hypothetical protein DI635_16930 [Pseudoxanthomonas suwonensis]|nr:MAG: hypothetical protein DI635_16930 [Pseudoxanthomonas suwonensis]
MSLVSSPGPCPECSLRHPCDRTRNTPERSSWPGSGSGHSTRETPHRSETDALMVTLKKSEADYSPTTTYRDFAINQDFFHWESQSTTSAESATGRRYTEHEARGTNVVLFVRRAKTGDIGTEPYTCLGTVRFDHATGTRPMQIVWKLDREMPVDLFLAAKAAA